MKKAVRENSQCDAPGLRRSPIHKWINPIVRLAAVTIGHRKVIHVIGRIYQKMNGRDNSHTALSIGSIKAILSDIYIILNINFPLYLSVFELIRRNLSQWLNGVRLDSANLPPFFVPVPMTRRRRPYRYQIRDSKLAL